MKFIIENNDTPDVKLKMFERTMMPDSVASKDSEGKTIFTKTGNKSEYTTYTFVDSFGEKLVFLSKDSSYRTFEGKFVNLVLEVVYDDFKRKSSVKLVSVKEVKSTSNK